MGEWKLIEHFETGHLELFNLENNIAEQINGAKHFPDRPMLRRPNMKGLHAAWNECIHTQSVAGKGIHVARKQRRTRVFPWMINA